MTAEKDMIAGRNGTLCLRLGWRYGWHTVMIQGGPFDAYIAAKPDDTMGICLRAEKKPTTVDTLWVPIKDFSIPQDDAEVFYALKVAFRRLLHGNSVYVGCMGGWGRTGLFLSLMAKVAGVPDPVAYVRSKYTTKAVETKEQAAYVRDFDVRQLQKQLQALGWRLRIRKMLPMLR